MTEQEYSFFLNRAREIKMMVQSLSIALEKTDEKRTLQEEDLDPRRYWLMRSGAYALRRQFENYTDSLYLEEKCCALEDKLRDKKKEKE